MQNLAATGNQDSDCLPTIDDAHSALTEALRLVGCDQLVPHQLNNPDSGIMCWIERCRGERVLFVAWVGPREHGTSLSMVEAFEAAERVLAADCSDEGVCFDAICGVVA